jgi:Aspartyl/Asparaginyl beta-hydroxylase.
LLRQAQLITPHTDQENKIKIHIPIIADETHWWTTNDGLDHMYPGNAYILDVKQIHGTINCGHVTRAHVIIICDDEEFDNIYNISGII